MASVTARINPRHQYAAPWLAAMANGMRRHGVRLVHADPDIEVVWSFNQDHIIEPQLAGGRDVLVLEQGYLGDRRKWTSCGFNGLNGRAWFPEAGEPARGSSWRHLLQPAHAGDYILIMGQCPGDRSVRHIHFETWAKQAAEVARELHSLPVRYRPHPLSATRVKGLRTLTGTLEDALSRAHLVYTFNSNTGVDAVLNGCALSTWDRGSMAWELASHDGTRKELQGREAWLNRLAWCQWSMKEFEDGTAWEHLAQRYH